MHTFNVQYFVAGVGNIQEQILANSEYNVRRLVEAKYPGRFVRIVQVTQVD